METKSRYEIIAELEEKKAKLISSKAGLGLYEANLKRAVEKAQEQLNDWLDRKDIEIANLNDQLESIEKSLGRFDTQKK